MKRKRYSTVELISELRNERRNAVLLGLAGVIIVAFLVGVYVTSVKEEHVPAVPATELHAAQPSVGLAAEEVKPIVPQSAAPTEDKPAEPKPGEEVNPAEQGKPSSVRLVLTKKAAVSLDGKSLGSLKEQTLLLQPGKHELRVKLGKKTMTQPFTVAPDTSYELKVDAKKKKALLKKVK